jgi:hypothetical protein
VGVILRMALSATSATTLEGACAVQKTVACVETVVYAVTVRVSSTVPAAFEATSRTV